MSKKIYVGNLPFRFGFKELKEVFEPFGEIEDALVISNKFTGRSKGFGFVTYKNDADADKAVQEMDGKEVDGRPLKVNEARPMEEKGPSQERPKESEPQEQ